MLFYELDSDARTWPVFLAALAVSTLGTLFVPDLVVNRYERGRARSSPRA